MSNPEISTSLKLLLAGYRLDGRSLTEYREIAFRFPQFSTNVNRCSCIATVGATAVLATVSVEVIEPKPFRPSQGTLFVNFDTGLVNVHTSNPRSLTNLEDEGRRLSTVLQSLLRDSIDLDALCIVAWERVFAVRVELRTLSYDGNLGDCGALAALLSLATFKRPDIFVEEDGTVTVDFEAKRRPRVSLGILRFPVLVTLGLAPDTDIVVQDASAREEEFLTGGRIMIGVTGPNEICSLYTYGLTKPVGSERLRKCVQMAGSTAPSLIALIRRVLDSVERHSTSQKLTRASHPDQLKSAATADLGPTSLVISSTSFLHEPVTDQMECQPAEVSAEHTKTIINSDDSSPVQPQPAHNDPYGVIEISSLCTGDTVADSAIHINELEDRLEIAGLSMAHVG